MPLKIIPSRNAKAKNLYIRGAYLGVRVDKSCRTDRGSVARLVLKNIERQIERGEYSSRQVSPRLNEPTFLTAAIAYMETGHRARYVARLIKHFGETPLAQINQAAIDAAAVALYPHVKPATRNTCVYTPASAILHHAGVDLKLRRPPGAKGRVVTDWLVPDDAFGIIAAAETFDPELALLLKFLLYTGVRIGAALNVCREDVRLTESAAWVRHQKGQPAADVRLRDDLRDALAVHLASHDRRRVFRFHQGGHLKHLLVRAKLAHLGIACPARRPVLWRVPKNRLDWCNFHTFRHTWATWMRKYGNASVDDLLDTGNWTDARSPRRYVHAASSGVWDGVDRLPAAKRA